MVWVLYASWVARPITEDSLKSLKGKVLLIDVRSPSFVKRAPMGTTYNLPLTDIIAGYRPPDGYDYYITLSSCPKGGIAKRAAEILARRGLKAFYLVR
ncbi:MAG: hypothetical protein GXO29_01325 [Thermotogae bacterium]|nr:hypothetical protein [Thermotogota bacterium]